MYKSRHLFEDALFGNIIYNMLGIECSIQYFNRTDKTVLKAIDILEKGESFPKKDNSQMAGTTPGTNESEPEKAVA